MPEYRRYYQPGGSYFFTVVTEGRAPILCTDRARPLLRHAIHEARKRLPFKIDAFVLLPDHLHAIWNLPVGNNDYSKRWSMIKRLFTQAWLGAGGNERRTSDSRDKNRRRGVWQRRFWEHLLRDEADFEKHCDYIHFNPVKHGHVTCPHAWPYSTYDRFVREGYYAADWSCSCNGRLPKPPDFQRIETSVGE